MGNAPTVVAGAPANSAAGTKGKRQDGASQADGANVWSAEQLTFAWRLHADEKKR